jgi:dTDP-L-rhamnose 4-epimerase
MKFKSALITGGAGFIGSNLSLNLVNKGYFVRVLDNFSPQVHGENYIDSYLYRTIEKKVEVVKGDIRQKEDWIKALKDVEVIVHLAAETGTGQSMYEIEKYVDVNIKGTSVMLDILTNMKHSVKKIILASSRAVYGEGKYYCQEHGVVYPGTRSEFNLSRGDFASKCPICGADVVPLATTEDSKLNPNSIYGFTKKSQEEIISLVSKSLNIPYTILRYQNVFGPGQSLKNPYTGILSIFSNRIKNHKDIIIFEDGQESRDFIFIDDVIEATTKAIERDESNYEIFNVGSGTSVSVLTVAQELIKKFGTNSSLIVNGSYRVGDIRHNYADISKIKKILEFVPKYDFETGISKFVEWVKMQNVEEDKLNDSLKEMKSKGLYRQGKKSGE